MGRVETRGPCLSMKIAPSVEIKVMYSTRLFQETTGAIASIVLHLLLFVPVNCQCNNLYCTTFFIVVAKVSYLLDS